MARNRLVPIPYRSKFLTTGNFLSEPWSKFILRIYERVTILQNEFIVLDISRNESTALTTGTGKFTFRLPFAFEISEIRASVTTAPTGASIIVDVNESGTSILSTKLSIDAGEKTSATAATPAVVSDVNLAEDSELTVDIDQIGSGTAGAGLKLYLLGARP